MNDDEIGPVQLRQLIASQIPEFGDTFRAHIGKWGMTAQGYSLVPRLLAFAAESWKAENVDVTSRIFGVVEKALAKGDDNIRDLIEIEMIEPLEDIDEYRSMELAQFLGPRSRESLQRYRTREQTQAPAAKRTFDSAGTSYVCPVCHYKGLRLPPYNGARGSEELCPRLRFRIWGDRCSFWIYVFIIPRGMDQ